MKSIFLKTILICLGICAVGFGLFLLYATLSEYQPADEEILTTNCIPAPLPDTLTVVSWNIGYAGLGNGMDFFYDGGRQVRCSQKETSKNLTDIIAQLRKLSPDIILLQEVDRRSKRSYYLDEYNIISDSLPGYQAYYAANYRVNFVPIPVREPVGRVEAGQMILTRYKPYRVTRLQYPGKFSYPMRIFNLKRCLLLAEFRTSQGWNLAIGNTHNSAYDKGGMRQAEMKFLQNLMARPIPFIIAGDWNQTLPNDTPKINDKNYMPIAIDTTLFSPTYRFHAAENSPSMRYLNQAWNPQTTATATVDFFLSHAALRCISTQTIPLNFHSSDHNPVVSKFIIRY